MVIARSTSDIRRHFSQCSLISCIVRLARMFYGKRWKWLNMEAANKCILKLRVTREAIEHAWMRKTFNCEIHCHEFLAIQLSTQWINCCHYDLTCKMSCWITMAQVQYMLLFCLFALEYPRPFFGFKPEQCITLIASAQARCSSMSIWFGFAFHLFAVFIYL